MALSMRVVRWAVLPPHRTAKEDKDGSAEGKKSLRGLSVSNRATPVREPQVGKVCYRRRIRSDT